MDRELLGRAEPLTSGDGEEARKMVAAKLQSLPDGRSEAESALQLTTGELRLRRADLRREVNGRLQAAARAGTP